mgnify:CR=1 FL=1
MEIWWMVLTGLLALCTLVLLLRLTALRHSLREVAEELEEKLQTDTNTLISLSTGDRAAMALRGASGIWRSSGSGRTPCAR